MAEAQTPWRGESSTTTVQMCQIVTHESSRVLPSFGFDATCCIGARPLMVRIVAWAIATARHVIHWFKCFAAQDGHLDEGCLLRWLDLATCACAERHTRVNCVTASVADLQFGEALCWCTHVGTMVTVSATPVKCGNTSLGMIRRPQACTPTRRYETSVVACRVALSLLYPPTFTPPSSPSLSLSLFLSLCLCLSLSRAHALSLSLSLSFSLCLSLARSLSVCLCLSLCVSLSLSLSLSLSVCVCVSLSLALSLSLGRKVQQGHALSLWLERECSVRSVRLTRTSPTPRTSSTTAQATAMLA